MAFFILSELFRDDSEKYAVIPPNSEAASGETTRCAVLRKTMPSQSLFDLKNPMPWKPAVDTDITRWRVTKGNY